MIMLNCWRVNESLTVDIKKLLIQTLSAVFATQNLLELGGDEYDNLNVMNFKFDSFKSRKKIREFYELLKFIKFEISIIANQWWHEVLFV